MVGADQSERPVFLATVIGSGMGLTSKPDQSESPQK
jgi:hypothetical protein